MSVVGDDDEEACVKRVVSTCNIPSQRDAVVKPLQEFARTKLHLPLMLHPMPQVTLIELSRVLSSGSSSMRTLVDVISFIQSKLEDNFPFSWVMFCSDVSDVFCVQGSLYRNFWRGRARVKVNETRPTDDHLQNCGQ